MHLPGGPLIIRHQDIEHTFWNGGNHLDIYYGGTKLQWQEAVSLSIAQWDGPIEWNTMETDLTVHCTDGDAE